MQENDNSINKDIRFEALFNSASLGIIVVDKNGKIVLANHFANKLFAEAMLMKSLLFCTSVFELNSATFEL